MKQHNQKINKIPFVIIYYVLNIILKTELGTKFLKKIIKVKFVSNTKHEKKI